MDITSDPVATEGNISDVTEATSPEEAVEAAPTGEVEAAPVETPVPDPRAWLSEAPEEELLANDRIQGILRRTEKSAADREAARLRREAGSRESIAITTRNALQAQGFEVEDVKDFNFLYDTAYAHAMYDATRSIAVNAAESLGFAPEQLAAVHATVEKMEGTELFNYAYSMISAVQESATKTGVAGLKLADLSESHPLRAEIKAEAARVAAAEMRATQVEQAPKLETPPSAPQGTTGGNGVGTMADADRAFAENLITFQQYRQYREQFGVATAPGGR